MNPFAHLLMDLVNTRHICCHLKSPEDTIPSCCCSLDEHLNPNFPLYCIFHISLYVSLNTRLAISTAVFSCFTKCPRVTASNSGSLSWCCRGNFLITGSSSGSVDLFACNTTHKSPLGAFSCGVCSEISLVQVMQACFAGII